MPGGCLGHNGSETTGETPRLLNMLIAREPRSVCAQGGQKGEMSQPGWPGLAQDGLQWRVETST